MDVTPKYQVLSKFIIKISVSLNEYIRWDIKLIVQLADHLKGEFPLFV